MLMRTVLPLSSMYLYLALPRKVQEPVTTPFRETLRRGVFSYRSLAKGVKVLLVQLSAAILKALASKAVGLGLDVDSNLVMRMSN